MEKVKKFLNEIEKNLCIIFLAIMLIILTVQVVSRLFSVSNSWSEELARYLFIWVIFMGAAYAAEKRAHITIDTMTLIWPKKIRGIVEIIGTLGWIAFSLIILYYSWNYTMMLYNANRISLSLYINMAYPYAAIPVGYLFLTIRIIQRELIPRVLKLVRGQGAGVPDEAAEEGGSV